MGLTLPITCGICSQKFTAPAVADLIQTDAGKERLGTILEKLVEHIKTEHKQAYHVAMIESAQLVRLLCLMTFQTEDTGAIQLRDYMRYSFWQKFQKNASATDDELTAIATQMGNHLKTDAKVPAQYLPAIKTAFHSVLKQCRDIWCELGPHQPQPLIAPAPVENGQPQLVKP